MIDVIAFDADDTLWHTEYYYREAQDTFIALVTGYGVDPNRALEVFHRLEVDNLAYFGYGIRGFILSMIEAAAQLSGEQLRSADILRIVELGRGMTAHEIRLLDGVREALDALRERQLMLITKGDVLDQESKILRSGLGDVFQHVEIVSDKNPETYARVLERHSIDPRRFLMVGNSLRSDIAPVLALGGFAVYVPNEISWAHESSADLPDERSRLYEIASLRDLPALIEQIEAQLR